ncbi:MAG: diphosphokinase / guanosine-3,5-bis(diphosphate) 3-diphosphatase, partial [Campylobacterota bacterium]|nr:diphosphokinase / guanosine-3,5-bis(diphosphate) 3-diphosphatase [Campylobacterota bacterium]
MLTLLDQLANAKTTEQAIFLLGQHYKITDKIKNSIEFATKAHEGQTRKSGEPYVVHPILVSAIVAAIGGDETMIIASILHDVVEDTPRTLEEVQFFFDSDVASLVDGL